MLPHQAHAILALVARRALLNESDRLEVFEANRTLQAFILKYGPQLPSPVPEKLINDLAKDGPVTSTPEELEMAMNQKVTADPATWKHTAKNAGGVTMEKLLDAKRILDAKEVPRQPTAAELKAEDQARRAVINAELLEKGRRDVINHPLANAYPPKDVS